MSTVAQLHVSFPLTGTG